MPQPDNSDQPAMDHADLVARLDYLPAERESLARLFALFLSRPPPEPRELFPRYAELRDKFRAALDSGAPHRAEEAFLLLYCHLHGHEADYTEAERQRKDASGGYWCHAGGIGPLLKAGPWIGPETVSADLGAGNGLQGLLLQKLYPHRLAVQVEISSRQLETGRSLQRWLEIPPERVEWRQADLLDFVPAGLDFIYLYRPLKPDGPGKKFYENFAAALAAAGKPVAIFSVADCLKDFLPDSFRVTYHDGHLTCYAFNC